MKPKINMKKESLRVALGLGYVIGIYSIIIYFQLSFWYVFGLILCSSIGWSIWRAIKAKQKHFLNVKEWIKTALYILFIMFMFRILSPLGSWGWILGILLICSMILWRNRQRWLWTKHTIEAMIWGEPLYKFRKEGQKPPKLKVVWKK